MKLTAAGLKAILVEVEVPRPTAVGDASTVADNVPANTTNATISAGRHVSAALATLPGRDPAVASLPGLEPDDQDLAWMMTDALAAEGWDDLSDDAGREPEDLAQRLGEAIPAGQELAVFELMARGPHPDAADVLTVIGRHHPDKKIAKLARKSAYKAASRQAARRQ